MTKIFGQVRNTIKTNRKGPDSELTAAVRGKVEAKIKSLVDTLAELAILVYGTDEARTPRSILRLYNVSFMHANLCLDVLYPP